MAADSSASARPNVAFSALSAGIEPNTELAAEQHLAHVIGDILQKFYPAPKEVGFWWAVQVNAKGGVAYIYNLALSGTHGYTLFLDSIAASDGTKRIMRAGGELLERAGLARNFRNLSADKVAEVQRNVRGNVVFLK